MYTNKSKIKSINDIDIKKPYIKIIKTLTKIKMKKKKWFKLVALK